MPTITISLPATVTELQAEPLERVAGASGQVSQTVSLTAGAGSIVVAATAADWCWRFTEHGPGRRATRFCAVTVDAAYAALVDVDPGTLVAVVEPPDPAWEATAQAALDAASTAVTAASAVGINIKTAHGAVGSGVANDAPAFDSLVAYLNANGSTNGNVPITVLIPAGVYDVRAGGIRALTVSNITIQCDSQAIFILRDGPVWTLGNGAACVQNTWVNGGQPRCNPGDTLASTCSWVYGVNCANLFMDNQRFQRCQIFKGVSSTTLANIWVRHPTGSGAVDRHWIEIDTSANPNSAAAGLYLVSGGGYAYAPPANPAIVPRTITAATKANPVQITAASHGFATGDRVRHGGVVGMTQLNGVDATVTVVDANTYTLNGVDGTSFGTYSSGGWAAELLWSYPYDSAVVGIKGHWDTAKIQGGLFQHWPWLWSIDAQGTTSYLYDEEVTWDYGAKGRFDISLNGGSVTNVNVAGGWHFCLNEEWIRIAAPGSGFVTDLTIRGHVVGMTGRDFVKDALNKILNLCVEGVRVLGMGRARIGQANLILPGWSGNNNTAIRAVKCENPGTYYGSSTNLLPDVGITCYINTRYSLTDCEVNAVGTHYDVSPGSTVTAGIRLVRNNKRYAGGLPEYITTSSVTPPASATNTTNYTGLIQSVFLRGGTMTACAKNGTQIMSGGGPFSFDVLPGETWSVTYSAAPTLIISYRD